MASPPIIIDVHLFDEVLLADKATGIIKFIGEIKRKDGLFFGIDIKKGKGINSGCIKNKRYFRTKNNKETGRFTQIKKIIKSKKTPKSISFTVGDTIQCPQLNTTATIRYVGIPSFDKTMKTVYFGIELAHPKGDCNGEIYSAYLGKKISYFKCKPNHGLYIKSTEVTVNYTSDDINTQINTDNKPQNAQMQFDNVSNYDDEKAIDSNRDDEIARLTQQIETLQHNEKKHEMLLREYGEYKQETERNKNRMGDILIAKNEEIAALKQALHENKTQESHKSHKSQNEYEELLQEFNGLKDKYKKTKQKVLSLTGGDKSHKTDNGKNHNVGNNLSVSREYLERELEDLKSKQRDGKSKQRISGVLTKFAATDVKSATIILKEILKQWDSKFISNNSRVEYLKNFEQILNVIGNSMDMSQKNPELDPIVKNVVNIIRKCRESNDDSLKNTASELCQNDIILQFMMR